MDLRKNKGLFFSSAKKTRWHGEESNTQESQWAILISFSAWIVAELFVEYVAGYACETVCMFVEYDVSWLARKRRKNKKYET